MDDSTATLAAPTRADMAELARLFALLPIRDRVAFLELLTDGAEVVDLVKVARGRVSEGRGVRV